MCLFAKQIITRLVKYSFAWTLLRCNDDYSEGKTSQSPVVLCQIVANRKAKYTFNFNPHCPLLEHSKFAEGLITIEKRYELLICFNRVRKEFRNEKLLILFILNFIFLSSELSLENISFM